MRACAQTNMHTHRHKSFSSLSQMHPPYSNNTVVVVVNFQQRILQEHKKSVSSACRRADLTFLIRLFVCLPLDSILQQVKILEGDPGACVPLQPAITTKMAACFVSLIVLLKEQLLACVLHKLMERNIHLLNSYIYMPLFYAKTVQDGEMSVCVSVALSLVLALSDSPENHSSLIRLGLEATV